MKLKPVRKYLFPFFSRSLLILLLLFLAGEGIFSEESNRSVTFYHKDYSSHSFVILEPENFPLAKPIDYFVKIPSVVNSKPVLSFHIPSIMGTGKVQSKGLAQFLERNNPKINPAKAREIAKLYVEEAHREGVNPDVAFSQMCLETGFMRFGGDVHPNQHNFCGLGVVKNGVRGMSFASMRMGIRAHVQHLKAYASTKKMNSPIVDRRFPFVKRGSARKIDDLSGRWASDKKYSQKIVSLLKRLYNENGQ